MLTEERHQIILQLLQEKHVCKLQDFIDATGSSESTIRRDLSQLEEENKLVRVHGGASLLKQKRAEASMVEKSVKHREEKKRIASFAASLIQKGDCIYLDAGTTTLAMVPFLQGKEITVVTNAVTHSIALMEAGIPTILSGGYLKANTGALIGQGALEGISRYNFDKCFIGANGIHPVAGFTTPDPEEALIKRTALARSQECYVMADASKFMEVAFTQIAEADQGIVLTNRIEDEMHSMFNGKTTIKEVER